VSGEGHRVDGVGSVEASPYGLSVGLYGKLPSRGDFLQRRVSAGFVSAWDAWLQDAVLSSREALGERWLEFYLTSPVWRFFCAAGICGPAPLVGLMVPSVDRVGRYFPFTVVAELPSESTPGAVIRHTESLLASAEQLVLEVLDANDADFDAFDRCVAELGQQHPIRGCARIETGDASALIDAGGRASWHLPTRTSQQLSSVLDQLVGQRLTSLYGPISIWWTDGSSVVEPSSLIVGGLPEPRLFTAMIDGAWADEGWKSVPVIAPQNDAKTFRVRDTAVRRIKGPQFRSAASSDQGRVRHSNQDAYIERTEVGLWAVADGLGGLSDGDLASRMVCDALADVVPEPHFEATIESARRRLGDLNEYLHARGAQRGGTARSASTVVALFARGERLATLWAGDSRMYRWRKGELEQITRDHSLNAALGDEAAAGSSVITRAIGAESSVNLEVLQLQAEPGDRFLLCTDGLSRVLPEERICGYIGQYPIREAVGRLIAATLDAGAPDNVTVLLVEAAE
jgi:type VI secretion system protein ImpM